MTRYDRLPHACGETMIFENTASSRICFTDYYFIIFILDHPIPTLKKASANSRIDAAGSLKCTYNS
jgi:hypothetical protein